MCKHTSCRRPAARGTSGMRRVAYQTVARVRGAAEPLAFGGPGRSRDHQVPLLFVKKGRGGVKPTLRQTCLWPRPRAQFAFKDSMVHIICNSHYVSHFAAFFIVTGTKISVVESCLWFVGRCESCLRLQSRFALGEVWPARRAGFPHARQPAHRPARPENRGVRTAAASPKRERRSVGADSKSHRSGPIDSMILPQVHLRKPCYDFSFL